MLFVGGVFVSVFLFFGWSMERLVPVLKILAIEKQSNLTDGKYGDSQQIDTMKK